jgi:hypothetical protein
VSVEDDKCSGWPSTSETTENFEKIQKLIYKNRRWTVHELTDTVGISYLVCQILAKIWTCAALLWSLSPNSQQMIKSSAAWTCLEVQEKANEDPTFISGIKMGDESRFYG